MSTELYSPEEIKNFELALSDMGEFSPEFFKENLDKLLSWKEGIVKGLRSNFTKELSGKSAVYKGTDDDLFKGKDYYTLMELTVRKVPGQDVDYAAMLNEMEKLSSYMMSIQENTITPYKDFISLLLEKPLNLNTVSPAVPSQLAVDMDSKSLINAQNALQSLFGGNEASSTGKYGELFKSNRDYINNATRCSDLTKTLSAIDTRKLLKDITAIADICDLLIKRCKDTTKTNYVISDAMATELHNVTIHVATKIDLFSMYRYRMDSISNTFIENDKIIGR